MVRCTRSWHAELPDSTGENGPAFRALATRFATGHGAVQWHIVNKGELREAATTFAIDDADAQASPREAPALALGAFDVIEAHLWSVQFAGIGLILNGVAATTGRQAGYREVWLEF